MFPLGLALLTEVLAVLVLRVFPLHFYLHRLLVRPPWDPGQQAEIYGEREGKGRV